MQKLFNIKTHVKVRVLLYHHIPEQQVDQFHSQLIWLSKSWNFITPEQFECHILGQKLLPSNSILLTFDDGFKSNRFVADTVLESLNIKAIFFIVTEFISLNHNQNFKRFVAENICPGMQECDVSEDMRNMSWDDLKYLTNKGHKIGCHTATHARLSLASLDQLNEEVVSSADKIQAELGASVDHFAFTFGDISSFSQSALLTVQTRFKFLHTGLGGNNIPSQFSCMTIMRDSIGPKDSKMMIGALLEGMADWYFKPQLKILNRWLSEN